MVDAVEDVASWSQADIALTAIDVCFRGKADTKVMLHFTSMSPDIEKFIKALL
jgi:hypothetical protein